MYSRSELTAETLAKRLDKAKVGVIVRSLSNINPQQIAEDVSTRLNKKLYVSIVGYPIEPEISGSKNIYSTQIEDAVNWRSSPDLAGSIILFIQQEVPKLHSLNDLEYINSRDLTQTLLKRMAHSAEISTTQPQVRFWEALAKEAETFPLDLIEDFTNAVVENMTDLNAIPLNVWRIGLLRDDSLLQSNKDPLERINRNRDLIMEIGLLSEQSRKRLGGVLSRSKGETKDRLFTSYLNLKSYYRNGSKDVLKDLEINNVEELIRASKPTKKTPKVPLVKGNGENDIETPPKILKGKDLAHEVAIQSLNNNEESEKGLRELGEAFLNNFNNPQDSTNNVTISAGFNDRTIQLDMPDSQNLKFIGHTCTEKNWGGVVETNQSNIKSIVSRFTPDDFTPFNPSNNKEGIAGQCLFSLLEHFDENVLNDSTFKVAIQSLTNARNILLDNIELLTTHPFILFGGYPDVRKALFEYLDAYSTIFSTFRKYEGKMHEYDGNALRFVATEILRLEVIHLKGPNNTWKAVLTPLHPFHLWRYKEVLASIHAEDRNLNEDEKQQLGETIPNLPHMIHFLAFSPDVSGRESVVLPLAGSLMTLPTFENKTNRYLGSDGSDYLMDLLQKYELDAPYSKHQIRLALVDIPDITDSLNIIVDYLKNKSSTQITVEAYFTRNQNPIGEMAKLNYDDDDHKLGELLKSGKIRVQIINKNSIEEVCNDLKSKPVHIAYLFDQSIYQINHAPRARQLLVSPLVISYQYDYSESFNKGTIAPSSEAEEGMFSDFHFLVERAASLPAGQQLRLQYESHDGLEPINQILNSGATRWLAIADRSLTGYSPYEGVLLSEVYSGQREIAVWTKTSTRSVGQFVDLLRTYHLKPDPQNIALLLNRYSHIASGGVMTLLSNKGNSKYKEAQQKGFLGTVLAAAWYNKKYPNSLIASLDSKLAQQWLRGRASGGQRADLIGLRLDEDESIIIEPIEVKSLAETSEAKVTQNELGQKIVVGEAVEQLKSMLKALDPIFGLNQNEISNLFTPARREVLRYQLHRECFRDMHESKWQKEWYERLANAFALPEPRITVKLRGLIVDVKFEENTDLQYVEDDVSAISLVTLGSQSIQKLVNIVSSTETLDDTDIEKSDLNVELKDNFDSSLNNVEAESKATNTSLSNNNGMDGNQGKSSVKILPKPFTEDLIDSPTEQLNEADNVEIEEHSSAEAEELARLFRRACQSYRISIDECDPAKAVVGPTVWRFFIKLTRGQRLDPLRNSLEDIGREMRKSGLLVNPIADSDYISLDIPRNDRQTIMLNTALNKLPKISSPEQMPVIIGITPENECLIKDLGKMPHLLVGGTTGSGKTVFLYGILTSLLKTHPNPESLRLIVSTSKPEDFMFYEGLSHLENGEIISDADDAINILETNVKETFENRLDILKESRSRDITEYNKKNPDKPLPPLVVIIDEFADLADQLSSDKSARESFYTNVRRIAQLGRSRGIHLILCTQRPSRDLVPTNIRNLMNSRVSLRVNDTIASRMILEESGGEQLLKHGDLLYKDEEGLVRAQGYFMDTIELEEFLEPLIE